MHKLYNWMPYGEIECSNLARGVSRANLVALCTNSYADWRIWLPYGDYTCRMAILATLWRIRMPISECGCPKAIMNANWPFWLHYSEFECRLVILAALSAKLKHLFIRAHALCAKLNDLSLLLHALSAKLDGKIYNNTNGHLIDALHKKYHSALHKGNTLTTLVVPTIQHCSK